MITNTQSGTTVDEIADRIYRISTPVHILGGFTFNQYLVVDEEPLLFHTGPRKMFPWYARLLPASFPSNVCATSVFRTLRRMNAER